MRRHDFSVPDDPPELVAAERLESIAFDVERVADALEALAAEHGDADFEGWAF